MPYNLIFIDESESMRRAVSTIFLDNSEFKLSLINEPALLYKTAKDFPPDVIVLSYNTIDTGLKKSITEIKTSKEFSNTPLILLVPSDLSNNERDILIKLKSDGFIYRPIDKDSFISKIKRTLGVNNPPDHTLENTGNLDEKIYDISSFETKKIPASGQDFSVSADSNSTNLSDGAKEHGTVIDIESSELSQAFENLFKDDAIFKEFQNLNKKEEEFESKGVEHAAQNNTYHIFKANNPDEHTENTDIAKPSVPVDALKPVEPSEPTELTEPSAQTESAEHSKQAESLEPSEPSKSFDFSEKQQFEHNFDFKMEETHDTGDVSDIRSENTEEPQKADAIKFPDVIGTETEVISNPAVAEPPKPKNIGDILELNNSLSTNSAISINPNKSKGDLNLKILDEQNIIKLDDYLKNAIEKTLEEIKPQIIETIKTGLPEIIEKLVKEEIEKIKQQ